MILDVVPIRSEGNGEKHVTSEDKQVVLAWLQASVASSYNKHF